MVSIIAWITAYVMTLNSITLTTPSYLSAQYAIQEEIVLKDLTAKNQQHQDAIVHGRLY